MAASGFLNILSLLLDEGASSISQHFLARQTHYVLAHQHRQGGFAGRMGGADLYYTDFALRVLVMTSRPFTGVTGVCEFLHAQRANLRDITSLFNSLHAYHLLGLQTDGHDLTPLRCQQLTDGGYAREGEREISAYQSFLAALCHEILDLPFPHVTETSELLLLLQDAAGGFPDVAHEGRCQTNATAAVLAFLFMHNSLPEDVAQRATAYLRRMQGEDGGLRAHEYINESDLMSTFTGLCTLCTLDALEDLDLAALARFLKRCALPTGGFRASPADEGDIEYTYYGLATLALLNSISSTR